MDCIVTGKPYSGNLSENEISLFMNYNNTDHNNITFYMSACLQNNCKISACSKSKSSKRHNSCIPYSVANKSNSGLAIQQYGQSLSAICSCKRRWSHEKRQVQKMNQSFLVAIV